MDPPYAISPIAVALPGAETDLRLDAIVPSVVYQVTPTKAWTGRTSRDEPPPECGAPKKRANPPRHPHHGIDAKKVPRVLAIRWRDEDPGGAQSELWYADAVAGDRAQRQRLLTYNEDDVTAQLAIRRWTIDRATESEG